MSHSFTRLLYHCVFATKGRRAYLKPEIWERVYGCVRGIAREIDAHLMAIGGTNDHIHLLMELPGSLAVADAMRLIKTNSSKWIRETFPTHASFGWQTGYAAFTVSESVTSAVVEYIGRQQSHHRDRTFDEEIRLLAERHGITFDSRFFGE